MDIILILTISSVALATLNLFSSVLILYRKNKRLDSIIYKI